MEGCLVVAMLVKRHDDNCIYTNNYVYCLLLTVNMVGALIKYPFAMTDRKFYYDCRRT